ncbi:MAG TPA: NAD-dependent deacetylase [Spirochaetales bacterium]|nr:NAD-dependent deacetylase [Spirochaetales bacterium]
MDRFIKALNESQYCVVFTGAGVSTLSGIQDFRGEKGLYKKVDAEKIFDLSYFHQDPSYYYRNSKNFIYDLEEKEPNIIHQEIARLEKNGVVKAVITQNIDLLHRKAGSVKVIEVHGSPEVHKCLKCGRNFTFREISRVVQSDELPTCDSCGGIIKPEITFFGELLPAGALEEAVTESSRADLIVVLGSSLVVQPAASFPLYTLENGGQMVIVNNMATPLDSRAFLRYQDLYTLFAYTKEHI